MKIVRKFSFIEKPKSLFTDGWVPSDKLHFDPIRMGGSRHHVLMHDILEHQNNDGSSIIYEMLALGATYFIRVAGKWDIFEKCFLGAHDAMASDTVHFAELVKFKIPKCHNPEPVSDKMQYFYNELKQNVKSRKGSSDHRVHEVLDTMFQWYNKGYNRAARRWEDHDSNTVCRFLEKMSVDLYYAPDKHNSIQKIGNKMVVQFDTVKLNYVIRWLRGKKLIYKISGNVQVA